MFCTRYKQDICNYYMYLCGIKEDLKTYEEQLLDKCFNKNYETLNFDTTETYSPQIIYTNFIS
jgi:hypothetical protein